MDQMDLLNFVLVLLDMTLRAVISLSPVLMLWVLPSVVALFGLRRRNLDDLPLALWALLVSAIPLLGAVAFWILKPGANVLQQQPAALKIEGESRPI